METSHYLKFVNVIADVVKESLKDKSLNNKLLDFRYVYLSLPVVTEC